MASFARTRTFRIALAWCCARACGVSRTHFGAVRSLPHRTPNTVLFARVDDRRGYMVGSAMVDDMCVAPAR